MEPLDETSRVLGHAVKTSLRVIRSLSGHQSREKSTQEKVHRLCCYCLCFKYFFLMYWLLLLPFINKPIVHTQAGHIHTAIFLSPSYRSAAGCHRNGLIVAKWGMLMQSLILPAAVGSLCPSPFTVCAQHTLCVCTCTAMLTSVCLFVHVCRWVHLFLFYLYFKNKCN